MTQTTIHPNLAEYILSAQMHGRWPDTPEAVYALELAQRTKSSLLMEHSHLLMEEKD